jgi:hypothetical protein
MQLLTDGIFEADVVFVGIILGVVVLGTVAALVRRLFQARRLERH